ncbi:MAG TPA: hypothetical protein H9703_02195 [Candidatus Faecalibacterium faecigallinarum]|uniref:Uncharacterized protein n=1 Tax=Candidatus Faecalibacterium faecigallinarum TaxID=2838577 RepID=A0A9D2P694_9FIRM|nr:hypothetical protein [Candidatus Faecalibacterium faecigallinarum]
MGLLDLILRECMNWLHDAHRVVWTVLMLLFLAFLGGCTAILFLARHWAGGAVLGVLALLCLALLIYGLAAKSKPSKRSWNSYFDKPRKKP